MNRMCRCLCAVMFVLSAAAVSLPAANGGAGAANGANEYGQIPKFISIQEGTDVSSWLDRGDVFTSSAMAAVGDGTYYIKANLFPGVIYNYIFFARTGGTAAAGLNPNTTYYDCPRSSGDDAAFFVAIDSNNPAGTKQAGKAWFANVAGSDSRRVIQIPNAPYTTANSSGVWVYNNWSSTPVAALSALPSGGTSVDISIGAYSTWGTNEEYKAIDVYAGGKFYLYRASTIAGNYTRIASSSAVELGSGMVFTDRGLTTGTSYFYILIASDAYKGAMNAMGTGVSAGDSCLVRQLANGTTAPAGTPATITDDVSIRPAAAIPVYFKIEAPDWEYIAAHGSVVYLTPSDVDGRFYPDKIQGVITRVYLP